MAAATYFVQECPTCGRNLQVRLEYLGKKVACQHCSARFLAIDPSSNLPSTSESGVSLLDRADELISQSTIWLGANGADSRSASKV
jgi:DNA-directed RNA polymerase subunit RPC12/RpoP